MIARETEETRRCFAKVELPILKVRQRLPNCGRNRAYWMIRIGGSFGRRAEPLRRFASQFLEIFSAGCSYRPVCRFGLALNKRADQFTRRGPKRQDPAKRLEQRLGVAVCAIDQTS